ncbi:hypothetical protein EDD37DRAFT_659562 [Exophiala viscosa]|uniref:uncharacterized protein n=1 Tax=Exophiala viscosa TaxID=2486360 RepID=UPI002199424C|nr:hypothetical protein EDD37DRAFT_659562 [Exophiala viscosa]
MVHVTRISLSATWLSATAKGLASERCTGASNASSETDTFSLTEHDDDRIPPYAILSHRWLEDTEEPTFEDLENGTADKKLGYEKIRFCGEQARRDGLQYFWVDTCCINKTNHAELSQAINSMFRWYRNATRCYVYLSDVPSPLSRTSKEFNPQSWDSDFWKSKWFTRGWTLQELLAPRSIDFFSCEWKWLGNKVSLQYQIHRITDVPTPALQGAPLSQFSVDERFLWIERRQTKLKEDKVYSLLGILDVKIPLFYGEGGANAFRRVREVIDKREKCIQDLRLTDPRDNKKRIEETKGGLLEDSYSWILENSQFQQWRCGEDSPLLCIRGDPGKGKTMLLYGIINELHKSIVDAALLSYFFCQAFDSRINNAAAVLRGLIYMLVGQQPTLISHIQKKYDHAGKALFEDANAWAALSEILANILQDPSMDITYLVIVALDECVDDLQKLLDFIVQTSSVSPRVKWIVSSRKWPSIEKDLDAVTQNIRLFLELNEKSISAAVATYIQFKVDWLAKRNRYGNDTQDAVQRYLSLNADGTFLWVALVCQELTNISGWKAQKKLTAFPRGLDALYGRMIDQIKSSEDSELCKRILAVVSTVYRSVTLDELTSFVDMPDDVSYHDEALSEIIALCGSFLTLRERTVSFVHQSAKEFLLKGALHEISLMGSVHVMSMGLRRDIYGLRTLGYPIELVKRPEPNPLAALRYSCIYWVDHLCDWSSLSYTIQGISLQDGLAVEDFVRKKYLYWLEALSLCGAMSAGVISLAKLETLLKAGTATPALLEVVRDGRRFIMNHKHAIEISPLQVYGSALMFSPIGSLIRGLFKHEESNWIVIQPPMRDGWSACLQTLEGHSGLVNSVTFSHDSTRLASASNDGTIKIWDAGSGACLHTLKNHSAFVNSVTFSHDSARLASASFDHMIKIWDAGSGSGTCLHTLEVGKALYSISFDVTSSSLHTENASRPSISRWGIEFGWSGG